MKNIGSSQLSFASDRIFHTRHPTKEGSRVSENEIFHIQGLFFSIVYLISYLFPAILIMKLQHIRRDDHSRWSPLFFITRERFWEETFLEHPRESDPKLLEKYFFFRSFFGILKVF